MNKQLLKELPVLPFYKVSMSLFRLLKTLFLLASIRVTMMTILYMLSSAVSAVNHEELLTAALTLIVVVVIYPLLIR